MRIYLKNLYNLYTYIEIFYVNKVPSNIIQKHNVYNTSQYTIELQLYLFICECLQIP